MPAGEAQAEVDRSGDRTYHLSSLPGLESRPLAMRVWNPNAWTTREFPVTLFFFNFIFGRTGSSLLHGGLFAGCGVRASHCRAFAVDCGL